MRSKDDQEGHGREVGVPAFPGSPLCPVGALDAWLTKAAVTAGPVFRKVTRYDTVTARALSPSTVAMIVKRAADAAGIPPSRLAATRCALAIPPLRRRTAHPTGSSCARPAIAAWRPSRVASAAAMYCGRTRRGTSTSTKRTEPVLPKRPGLTVHRHSDD